MRVKPAVVACAADPTPSNAQDVMSPEVYRLSVVQLLPPHGCAMSLRDKIPSVQAPTGAPLSVMRLLALTVVLYTFFVLYMKGALAFELFQGDVVSYWNDSLTLATPYSTWCRAIRP